MPVPKEPYGPTPPAVSWSAAVENDPVILAAAGQDEEIIATVDHVPEDDGE